MHTYRTLPAVASLVALLSLLGSCDDNPAGSPTDGVNDSNLNDVASAPPA